MPQVKPIAKIHCAAAYFAFVSRDINAIAAQFNVKNRAVRRWAEDPEWHKALEICGASDATPLKQPTRHTERDAGDIFEEARQIYVDALNTGTPKHKLATLTAEKMGLKVRRVRNWAKRFGWRETTQAKRTPLNHDPTSGNSDDY